MYQNFAQLWQSILLQVLTMPPYRQSSWIGDALEIAIEKPDGEQRDWEDSPGDALEAEWKCDRDSIAECCTDNEESNTV